VFNFFRKSKSWKELFEKGMAFGAASDFEKAADCFRQATRLAPSEPYPHYELGYTMSLLGRHKEALQEFETTDRLARGFFLVQTEAYLSRQFLSGEINELVLEKLRRLQRLTDTRAGNSDEAVAVSREVISSAPKCALGQFYLGKALITINPYAAEQALQKCVDLGSDETTAIDAKFHLGLLCRERGEEQAALRIWTSIVADYAGNPHTKFAEMMVGEKPA
jgi:tetratricopeptide (TPR) repeat protein